MPNNWSYSSLTMFEKCPKQYEFAKIKKLPQPASPAMERGNEIHARLERATRTGVYPPFGVGQKRSGEGLDLAAYIEGLATRPRVVEQMWVFDREWNFLGVGGDGKWYDGAWLYAKLDVYLEGTRHLLPRVIDWKTGRRYDDHEYQAGLYAVAAASRKRSDEVEVDMVYVDQGEVEEWTIPTFDLEAQQEEWSLRASALLEATSFPATPGPACNWCAFSQRKRGPCRAG